MENYVISSLAPSASKNHIISGSRRRGRDQIEDRASRAAEGFRRQGIGGGSSVALLLRNDFAFFEATRAISLTGAHAVPINWRAAPDEWAYIIRDCAAGALVAHTDLLKIAAPILPSGIFVLAVANPPDLCAAFELLPDEQASPGVEAWEAWSNRFPEIDPPAGCDTGAVIYTSGSTGRPKGVRRPAQAPSKGPSRAQKVYGFDLPGKARVLVTGPMYHSVPNAYARLAFQSGADIVLQAKFEPVEMLGLVETHRITHMHIVPAMAARLLNLPPETRQSFDVSSLRHIVHGAAHCPPAWKSAMISWFGPIIHEYYGSTETGLLTWLNSAQALLKPGSVGCKLPGIELTIRNADGQMLGTHETGDIYARSSTLHQFSYIGQPERRAEIGRGDYVTAGDQGWLDQDGYLFLAGRKKDVIIAGGTKTFAAEIEAVIMALPGVNDCAVIGRPGPSGAEIICAFVEPAIGDELTKAHLNAALADKLPPTKRPGHIEIVAKLPREDSGKIFKHRLHPDESDMA